MLLPTPFWRAADHAIKTGSNAYLAEILATNAPGFSLKECRFSIAKRFDQGIYAGFQIGIAEHLEMGEKLGEAVLILKNDIENTGSLRDTSPISSPTPLSQGNRRRSFTSTTASTSMPPAAGTRAATRRNASHHRSATNLSLS
uniref:Acyl-CoA_dh_1 domain-containing protein n=1 Tax=Panagrellus redivivus TaxID=6233 RepID=A0A7E4VSY2_PANRE